MPRFKGFFIDYLVESSDPNYTFETKRIHFAPNEKKAYEDFLKGHATRIVSHGERYS